MHCASPPILPDPSGPPFLLFNGHIPEPDRTLIPAHHVGPGRNVVAVSEGRGQTRRLMTAAPAGRSLMQAVSLLGPGHRERTASAAACVYGDYADPEAPRYIWGF